MLPRALLASLISVPLVAGCLSVPDGPTPMCKTSHDCDTADGEVCEDGVCWGDPPPGQFAAVVSPPSARRDLVSSEIAALAIPADGQLGQLQLDAPVVLSGQIAQFCMPPTPCDPSADLSGTITLSRSSQFAGGPGFQTVASAAASGVFSILLPPNDASDLYQVTVVPDGGQTPTTTPTAAQQVPPLRLQLQVGANVTGQLFQLGGADLPVLSGNITDTTGQGLTNYRVVALGHWNAGDPVTEVSSVDFLDSSGAYAVMLSDNLVGTVELVAQPPTGGNGPSSSTSAMGSMGPAVHLTNIDPSKSSQHSATEQSVSLGNSFMAQIQVTGVDLSGAVINVSGATVEVTGELDQGSVSFTLDQLQATDQSGMATFSLLDGTGIRGSYTVSITPPAGSTLGAMYEQKLTLPAASGGQVPIRLGSRVELQGTVVDSDGKPLGGVAVTAKPSLRFLWTLPADPQAFVAGIPAATTVTTAVGGFQVWVDGNIDQVWGEYDLDLEPATTSDAPAFVVTTPIARDVTVTTMALGSITVPDAAYIHGTIVGPDGTPVSGAELKLYSLPPTTQPLLCTQVAHAPASCPIPAQQLGRNTSDDDGTVRLNLPR